MFNVVILFIIDSSGMGMTPFLLSSNVVIMRSWGQSKLI
jgi:hypothetical protein